MKIALIRERKKPADLRVALSPQQARKLEEQFPQLEIVVERSPDRIFGDEMYHNAGIELVHNANSSDVLFGIKEVPVDHLIPSKTYFFFSHTHKMQEYNRPLLRAALNNNVRLIDYECLEWPSGGRILGFGKWAGIVGVYNGMLTWGKKYQNFQLKPAHECASIEELLNELEKVVLPPIKIALTGTGRVANGALEILKHLHIREVEPRAYREEKFNEPVFTNLKNDDVYQRIDRSEWDNQHFYNNHESYESIFNPYTKQTDMLINGMYWESTLPALFRKNDTKEKGFRIRVIADITCDVEGSVPITMKATSIHHPVLGWDYRRMEECEPFLEDTIDVMAVTNLPTELPADASRDFGEVLSAEIVPLLLSDDPDGVLKNATLTQNGQLTEKYSYLKEFAYSHD